MGAIERRDRIHQRREARATRYLDNYGVVLILLVASFMMITGGSRPLSRVALIFTLAAAVVTTYRASSVKARTMTAVTIIVVVILAFSLVALTVEDRFANEWALAPLSLLVLLGPWVILNRVFRHEIVTFQTILGAICAYMYFGLIFALLFGLVDAIDTEPFFAQGPTPNPGEYTYFSFVTMTTLGYGDLAPGTEIGKNLAVLEALIGSIYLVTLVGRLVGMYGNQRPQASSNAGNAELPDNS